MAPGAEPAAAGEAAPEAAPLTLAQRMAAIRAECFGIGKTDITMESQKGAKYTIKAHTVEAILSEIRPLLDKHGLDLIPNLVERTYSGNRCDVLVDFTFERLDRPLDYRTIRWGGAGTDNGDKGLAKAGTNALKEMLKKVFLVTDRDDAAEATEAVEHKTEDGVSREDLARVSDQRRAAIAQWARAVKMAIEKADDIKDLRRIERENADQFSSPDLPDVTRTFFHELLEKRKTECGPKGQVRTMLQDSLDEALDGDDIPQ